MGLWACGEPKGWNETDSSGNGHTHWYAQDAISAKHNESALFHFTKDPDFLHATHKSNLFWHSQVGNNGFIGFSNNDRWGDVHDYFAEACAWAGREKPGVLLLLGHWDDNNLGCASRMATPDV